MDREISKHACVTPDQRLVPNPRSDDISPTPPPRPSSKFESLSTELRLQIYSLLLDGKPGLCLLEKCEISRSHSRPRLYHAILAVNRSISAEAYPNLYRKNKFLYLDTTAGADQFDTYQEFLGPLAGLPKSQKSPLLPKQSRPLIKHIAAAPLQVAKTDWADRFLQLAPLTKTVEFDFWVVSYRRPPVLEPFPSISTLNVFDSRHQVSRQCLDTGLPHWHSRYHYLPQCQI